ncbi:signal peptidase I [Cellulomonas xylanilytica]|uniref:Signal peptidase I n=1 Tax=Cellulomonas xylanilytica TaxID=233583 RepID=A0A510V5L5_9CELL|nr:signal peptidase I [Cellulomonas xylanilytica]GEK22076.1 hypothetical protein CXY01_25960 [Cellulomonas xylanilytica]
MTAVAERDAEATPAARTPRSVARWAGAVLSSLALLVVVVVALALIVIPLLLGATPYTVLTGSMRPTMPPGDLVVTRPQSPDDISLGDVITYQLRSNEPEVVTHRVVGVGTTSEGERTFVTRGDANNVDDDPILAVQVRGVVVYHVPYLGYLNTWVGANRPGWLLKGVAGALILYGIFLVGSGVRDRFRRRSAAATDVQAPEPVPAPGDVVEAAEVAPAPPSAVVLAPVARPLAARRGPRITTGVVVVCTVLVAALALGGLATARRSAGARP